MKEIQLTQGKVALVDDEDFERLNQFRWHTQKHGNTFYAIRTVIIGGRRPTVRIHQIILNGTGIDHIDHNGLNNQKSNLRFCSPSENMMNRGKVINKSSIYKGVIFHKASKKWRARISINRKNIHIGLFCTEIEAAKAYNAKAIELFGEFANLNKVDNLN